VTLPPAAAVRPFVEACRNRYPGTELVARRELDGGTSVDTDGTLPGELTAHQREAVLAAYEAGYFEWPREHNGQDIAARLGVTPPTFHQHLRKGLAAVLEATADRGRRRSSLPGAEHRSPPP
jgi:hypothetical protein